ncbi:MAG: helix-turn-helix domain-containing protein [Pseudomonadales bacterium]|nr:helix-turn-helix domain-containing protein [Pseudomonadales bacterium]MCP5302989.1 helix-turn-helix domain-containing protein [Pseudomonadales bacterium]
MSITTYRTHDIHKKQQFEFWNELICKEFIQLECNTSDNSTYRGELTTWDLSSIQISKVCCDPSDVHHSKWQVAKSNDDVYMMHVQASGESMNRQNGQEAHLKPGDFTLCNSKFPYSVLFNKPIEMLVLRIPGSILHQYFSGSEQDIIGRKISGDEQLGAAIYSLLVRLWQNKQHIDTPQQNINICKSVLSLLATQLQMISPTGNAAESSVRASHMQRIKMYIEHHLADPMLSPATIANSNGVSPRYLRLLFEKEGLTCSRYVINRRLEEVARNLANPSADHMKIIEIAYRWGFSNPSHFSRTFKEHFLCAPQDYRSMKDKA